MKRTFSPWTVIVTLLVLFIIAQLFGALFAQAFNLLTASFSDHTAIADSELSAESQALGLLVTYIFLVVILWALDYVNRRFLRPQSPILPPLWAAALMAFMLTAIGFGLFVDKLELSDNGALEMLQAMIETTPGLLLICFFGPLVEELVFREGLLRQLGRTGMHHFPAAIITAFLFAVVHIDLAQLVPALLLGVLLAYLYYMTGDIRLSLLAHVINNTCSVLLIKFPALSAWFENLGKGTVITASLSIAIAGILAFYAVCRIRRPRFIASFGAAEPQNTSAR